ncbi:MAG: CARDB domain-containing protein [Promethearchaeota archaeon]
MRKNCEKLGLIIIMFFLTSIIVSPIFIMSPSYVNEKSKNNSIELNTDKTFVCEINGRKYLAEIITAEDVEEIKDRAPIREPNENYNQIIDGHGTGYAPPTEKSLEKLIGKTRIIEVLQESLISPGWGASKDISTEMYFPPVGNQGAQGSCTSWANIYYAYGYMEAEDYGWDASSGNPNYLLSPAWSYNKIAAYDYGSMPIETGELVKEWGVATMNTMLYNDGDVDNWGNETAWREAPKHRPLDFTIISYEGPTTINTIKSFLDNGIPVTFAVDASQFFNGLDDSPADYILNSSEYDSNSFNHAQCFVGYDDLITEGSDVGAFRVVNSWGASWIDNGYYWLTYDAFDEIGGMSGQYIGFYTDRPDYNPTLIATWEFSESTMRIDDIITLGAGFQGSLDTIIPGYEADFDNLLPTFMALDISNFQSYYVADNDILFSLRIRGRYDVPGIISSFKVERYQSGIWQETTPESFDVPKSTPGHAHCSFNVPDHELKVLLELPSNPEKDTSYTINATVTNLGINTETDVELYLYLDEDEVNSATFPSLLPGAEEIINYLWTPDEYKCYNITAYAPPVPSEFYEINNFISQKVRVHIINNYMMTPGYTFNWIDASGGTELDLDDDDSATVTLPFEFIFYDYRFSMISISSNGYLSFGDWKPEESTNDPFPCGYGYIIAPFWDDLKPDEWSSIYIQSFGTYWVVEWYNISHYDGDYVGTFEVVLYDTGEIIFNYEEINYIDTGSAYTCGLNYGLDKNYYNNYQGLTASTSDFSIRFINQTDLVNQIPCDSYFTLDVDIGELIIYTLSYFDADLALTYLGISELGPGITVGAYYGYNISEISDVFSGWNLTLGTWDWTTDTSDFDEPPQSDYFLPVYNRPNYLGSSLHATSAGMIIPSPVEEYLMAVDWYQTSMFSTISIKGRTISENMLVYNPTIPIFEWLLWTHTYGKDGISEGYNISTDDGELIFEYSRVYDITEEERPPPPPPDDDDDDDDDDGEFEFLRSPFFIIGIILAIGVASVAIYLIRKRRLKLKR